MISEKEVKSWGTWLRAAGRPETTISMRTYQVRRILREVDTDPWKLTTQQLVDYLASKSWNPNTRRSYRASLRSFYRWAQATGRRGDDPAHLIPSVKIPRGVPRPTPERVYLEALIDATPRVRLMVQLAAKCGLRRGEIARLRVCDVVADLVGYSLHVKGKGGHQRMVPLPDDLAKQLLRSGDVACAAKWIFPCRHRGWGPIVGPLAAARVGELVSEVLPDGWTCHTLRHRCATVAYASTRDLRAVQELLGHAKPETTMLYTQIPFDTIRAAVDAAAA